MRLKLFFLTLVFISAFDCRAFAQEPAFSDCKSKVEVPRKPLKIELHDSKSRRYASQFARAADQSVNFAGHYILLEWGCGAGCVMAGTVDAKTGNAVVLPFTVSDWPSDVVEPLDYRKDSCLLIVRGRKDERERGTYFYRFNGLEFKLLKAVES